MRVCPATKENQELIRFLEASFNDRLLTRVPVRDHSPY